MKETNGISNTLIIYEMDVKIRINNDFPEKSIHKWRLIVDGVQHLVDDIEINCKCRTTEDITDKQLQNHISCNAKKLSFSTKKEIKKVILT